MVDNTINFAPPPVPNTKVYVPDYSGKMKQEQAKLIDKLVDFAVLQRPENIGLVPEFVFPSLFVGLSCHNQNKELSKSKSSPV